MFAEPITLVASSVDYDFYRTRIDGNAGFYVWDGNTPASGYKLRILHADGAKSASEPQVRAQRHVITLAYDEYDSAVPRKDAMSVTVTITRPGTSVVSVTEENKVLDMITGFLNDSNVRAKLRRREV